MQGLILLGNQCDSTARDKWVVLAWRTIPAFSYETRCLKGLLIHDKQPGNQCKHSKQLTPRSLSAISAYHALSRECVRSQPSAAPAASSSLHSPSFNCKRPLNSKQCYLPHLLYPWFYFTGTGKPGSLSLSPVPWPPLSQACVAYPSTPLCSLNPNLIMFPRCH